MAVTVTGFVVVDSVSAIVVVHDLFVVAVADVVVAAAGSTRQNENEYWIDETGWWYCC